jgi:hypothetical protein
MKVDLASKYKDLEVKNTRLKKLVRSLLARGHAEGIHQGKLLSLLPAEVFEGLQARQTIRY